MKKQDYFEEFERTDDGWFGYLKEGYVTDNEEITITGDSKKDVLNQVYRVHKCSKEEYIKYWG